MQGFLNLNDPAAYLREFGMVEKNTILSATEIEGDSNHIFRIRSHNQSWIMKIANKCTRGRKKPVSRSTPSCSCLQTNPSLQSVSTIPFCPLMPFNKNPDVVVNNYRLANEWNLSPKVIQADLDEKIIVLEDLGRHCVECDEVYWVKLLQSISQLHRCEPFSMTTEKDAALGLGERVLVYEERENIREALEKMVAEYRRRRYHERTLVPSHGDVTLANVFNCKNRDLKLVDWDFAGNMPFYWDLAAILINHSISVEHYRDALKDYRGARINWGDLSFFCSFYSLVASSWYATTQVKETSKVKAETLFSYHRQFTSRTVSNG